ncbi:CinA family protein [Agrococcus sp. Ld7]|uniref:CinA family protein n=1 Tax=Agrococcus sp. Ld7 TaxID=649148 RepID=UPI003866D022
MTDARRSQGPGQAALAAVRQIGELSGSIVARAAARGVTIAVAESLTGGLVAATLVRTPGASGVLRLGVVAYATAMKHAVLHVPAALLAERGAVDPEVAIAMARGVRQLAAIDRAECTIGLATTGVAGPDAQEGHPPGEFHVGIEIRTTSGVIVESGSHQVGGDREAVRAAALLAALRQLDTALDRTDLDTHSQSTS